MRESVKKWLFVILFLVFALFVIIFLLIAPAEAQAPQVRVDIIPASFSPTRGGFLVELSATQGVQYRITVLWPKQLPAPHVLPDMWGDHMMRIHPPVGVHFQMMMGWRSEGTMVRIGNSGEWSGAEGAASISGPGQTRVEIHFSYVLLQKLEEAGAGTIILIVEGRYGGKTRWVMRGFEVKTILKKSPPAPPSPPIQRKEGELDV